MFQFLFSRVVKMREKVALDLGGGDPEKPFLEHLEDLRSMLVKMAMTVAVLTCGTFVFYKFFVRVLMLPLQHAVLTNGEALRDHVQIVILDPTASFMVAMRVTMVAGIVLSFPLLLYFLLQFILPGLRSSEKKLIFPTLGVGGGLFIGGVVFAYFFVIPKALVFFYEFGVNMMPEAGTKAPNIFIWNIIEYNKFVTQFCLVFGVCFELPVVIMALVKLGLLTYKVMKRTRSWAIVIIFVASAVIAPTGDVFTMSLLAVPMCLLYEICIWLAWYLDKKDREANPDYYKALDENERVMEAEEWDNESYNPWGGSNDDEEDDLHHPKPAPVSPPSGTVAHEPSFEEQHAEAHDAPALNPPVPHADPEHPATHEVTPPANPGLDLPEPEAPATPDHPVNPPIDLPASPGEQPGVPPVDPEHPASEGGDHKPKAPEDPHHS